jgi:hypothetical protein
MMELFLVNLMALLQVLGHARMSSDDAISEWLIVRKWKEAAVVRVILGSVPWFAMKTHQDSRLRSRVSNPGLHIEEAAAVITVWTDSCFSGQFTYGI